MHQDIADALFFEMPLVQTEAAILFGCRNGEHTRALAKLAADLYERKGFQKIYVSGGNSDRANSRSLEFQIAAQILRRRGIPAGAIVLEPAAVHTGDNIRLSLELGLGKAASITAICRTPHQRRVLMTMRRYLGDTPHITTATLLPGSERGITLNNWHTDPFLRAFAQSEYNKVVQPTENGVPPYVELGYCVPVDIAGECRRLEALPRIHQVRIPEIA